MRLWHQKLIPYLPRQQLLGQHRECCALRGKGWGRKHAIVDYVFKHEPGSLVAYHWLIMDEMKRRGYKPDPIWYNVDWRGNELGEQLDWCDYYQVQYEHGWAETTGSMIYFEHNDAYLQECLDNLAAKGILIENFKKI